MTHKRGHNPRRGRARRARIGSNRVAGGRGRAGRGGRRARGNISVTTTGSGVGSRKTVRTTGGIHRFGPNTRASVSRGAPTPGGIQNRPVRNKITARQIFGILSGKSITKNPRGAAGKRG